MNFKSPPKDLSKLKISELKSLADYWQRQYLLRNATRDGFNRVHCPITDKWYKEDKIHVCHIMDRGHINTRYNPLNTFLGSAYSNTFEAQVSAEGFKSLHHKKIKESFDTSHIDYLISEAAVIGPKEKDFYIDLINFYREADEQ